MHNLKNLDNITQPGCHIVCGLTPQQKEILEGELCKVYTDFKTVLSNKFYAKNLGPIKIQNKSTVEEFLLSDKEIKKLGPDFVNRWLSEMGVHFLKFKQIYQLSQADMELVQLIIDAKNWRRHYLFSEEKIYEHTVKMLDWLILATEFIFDCVITVLTEDSLENVKDRFSKGKNLKSEFKIYKLEDGELVQYKNNRDTVVSEDTAFVQNKSNTTLTTIKKNDLQQSDVTASPKFKIPRAKVMFIDAQKFDGTTLMILVLKEGEVKAEDRYEYELTGTKYKTTGAIRLNKGENPDDYVRSLNTKDKMFSVFVNSKVDELPNTFDELVVY